MKKIVFLLVLLLLLSSAAPISADNARTSGLYTYEIKGNGTITITDFDWENSEADVFIPNMIDGYSVTGIEDGAFAYGDIGEAYKERNMHYVVTLQDGITTIGDKAFWNADISGINIPSSVQFIGAGTFYGCPSCQFKVAPNHSYFAVIDEGLYEKSKKELLAFSVGNADSRSASGKTKNVTIPEGILSIGAYVFANMGFGLDEVVLPSTLASIGDYAFCDAKISQLSGNLSHLTTIGVGTFMRSDISSNNSRTDPFFILPSVETIGEKAFQDAIVGYYPLVNKYDMGGYINFTGSPLKQIGEEAFQNADIGYAIDFRGSPLKQIGEDAFDSIEVSYLLIEAEKCSDIGRGNWGLGQVMSAESAFSPSLTTIPRGLNPRIKSLPSTVTAIESGAFTDVVSDFRLSAALKDIAVDAFPRGSTFIVDAGSYAELWCSENGFGYSIEGQNNLDWLNN